MKDTNQVCAVVKENIYGHAKRLQWILSHIKKNDKIIEFGCGTGTMITLPLAKLGYSIIGMDLDRKSIGFGVKVFNQEGVDSNILKILDIAKFDSNPDVLIASEVLEHIPDGELGNILTILRSKLNAEGRALVTVPNGYGWFELESFLWFKAGIGKFLEKTQIARIISKLKRLIFGSDIEMPYPSTISSSSHVQRFTFRTIQNLLYNHGFKVVSISGSVLFAGPFSNLLFTGIKPIMRLNCILGEWFPKMASGFFIECLANTGSNLFYSKN